MNTIEQLLRAGVSKEDILKQVSEAQAKIDEENAEAAKAKIALEEKKLAIAKAKKKLLTSFKNYASALAGEDITEDTPAYKELAASLSALEDYALNNSKNKSTKYSSCKEIFDAILDEFFFS